MKETLKKLTVGMIKRGRRPLVIVLLVASAVALAATLWSKKADTKNYITSKIERGTVEVTVSATGTSQAVTTVQVGTQVSGTVAWLGADFNSQVKRGQVIARLDPAIFQTQVESARAGTLNAEAAVKAALSEINNEKANLAAAQANQEVARVQRDDAMALVKRYQGMTELISGRDLESAQAQASAGAAHYQQAVAQVGQAQAVSENAKAKLEQANAALAQAKAQFEQARVNLDHTIITSPIDGVVVSRNVDVGQTVTASLQAPTLFVIANDLTKMQVLGSVDEADVGQIHPGIKTNFTVDAFPGERFTGTIAQVRLNAQTQQNVVTYTAVIEVANPELKLRPGMTANIIIPSARREDVLLLPNAALRFKPELSQKEQQELRAQMEARRSQRQQAGGSVVQAASPENANQNRQGQTIWVLTPAGKIEPRFVRTGITNGRVTEVVGGNVQASDLVVIGQNEPNGNNRPQTAGAPLGQRPGMGLGPRGR